VLSRPFGSPFWNRTNSALPYKVLPNEEFASEIFFPSVPASVLLHRERRCLAGGKMLQKRRLSTASEPPAGDERLSKVRRRAISLQIKNL
jgi:hypothetical protein